MNEVHKNYEDAFLASKAKSLYDLIVSQGAALLNDLGAKTPSNCVSIVLLLESYESLSSVQISQKLEKSHQLISQRINKLEKLGLIYRSLDESDKRAKVISLSQDGMDDLLLVKQSCEIAEKHFQKLYRELNLNLGEAIEQLEEQLKDSPISNS